MIISSKEVVDSTESEDFQPLEVIAHLVEPVVHYDEGMLLDGPLQWSAVQRLLREGVVLPPNDKGWTDDFEMKVAKWTRPLYEGCDVDSRAITADGQIWGWCCSDIIVDWDNLSKTEVRKKPEISMMKRYAADKSFDIALGPHKAKNLTFPTYQSRTAKWYLLGDIDEVRELLSHVVGIGKLRNMGYGAVERWEVKAHKDRNGWLRREMPHAEGKIKGIRAPHWCIGKSVKVK